MFNGGTPLAARPHHLKLDGTVAKGSEFDALVIRFHLQVTGDFQNLPPYPEKILLLSVPVANMPTSLPDFPKSPHDKAEEYLNSIVLLRWLSNIP